MSKNRLEKHSAERLESMKSHCQDAIQRIDNMESSPILEYARKQRIEDIERIDEALDLKQSK